MERSGTSTQRKWAESQSAQWQWEREFCSLGSWGSAADPDRQSQLERWRGPCTLDCRIGGWDWPGRTSEASYTSAMRLGPGSPCVYRVLFCPWPLSGGIRDASPGRARPRAEEMPPFVARHWLHRLRETRYWHAAEPKIRPPLRAYRDTRRATSLWVLLPERGPGADVGGFARARSYRETTRKLLLKCV
jgi:hypothetical protein